MSIVMADDSISFDGKMKDEQPLGGAETAFAELAEALAARGHRVSAHCRCLAPLTWKGVQWVPLDASRSMGIPDQADLYIANRGYQLIGCCRQAGKRVLWLHNPADYLLKLRYQWPLLRHRPTLVFGGAHHLSTYPEWAAGRSRTIIPLGITPLFLGAARREPPANPRAVFMSNPLRSLDWLLDVWAERIRPRVANAELHVFAGHTIYGSVGAAKESRMTPILDKAAQLAEQGVVLRGPVPKQQLVAEIAEARAFLYRGDPGETFCYAAAEPQAMGLPGVVEDIACMKERVEDGETGFVVKGQAAFAQASIRLLTDDDLWRQFHAAALERQGRWTWAAAAAAFEALA